MAKHVSPLEHAAATRDLARRLAQALILDDDRARLMECAEQLEEEAGRIESADGGRPDAQPVQVEQRQVQEQQQEASDAPDSTPEWPESH